MWNTGTNVHDNIPRWRHLAAWTPRAKVTVLSCTQIDKQDAENCDSIYKEITHNNKKLILSTVYRAPKLQADNDTALYNEIQSLIQGKNAMVIGDFNCGNVDWRLLIGEQEGSTDTVMDSFFMQVVTQPTRENNFLDLVLVSDLIRDCEVAQKLSGCDHHIICFTACVQHKLADNSTLIPNYWKVNFKLSLQAATSHCMRT